LIERRRHRWKTETINGGQERYRHFEECAGRRNDSDLEGTIVKRKPSGAQGVHPKNVYKKEQEFQIEKNTIREKVNKKLGLRWTNKKEGKGGSILGEMRRYCIRSGKGGDLQTCTQPGKILL